MLTQETREEIERRALEITATLAAKQGKFTAEIVAGYMPQWYLVEAFENQEFKAARFLLQRHVGVFVPTFEPDASLKVDGVELCNRRGSLIFPGHLFVFVWDMAQHWRRIKGCPGVRRVLLDHAEHPAVVSEKDMDFIQALQFSLSPRIAGVEKGKKRPRRTKYQQEKNYEGGQERVTVTTPSFWRQAETLDDDGRNRLLHKALGLETITP